jgi:hypothetical protein
LKIITEIVADRVVNIVTYIPVAVATWASIPIRIKIGQKMNPGPTPEKAAAIAPKKEIPTNITRFLGVASISPAVKLYPSSTFS